MFRFQPAAIVFVLLGLQAAFAGDVKVQHQWKFTAGQFHVAKADLPQVIVDSQRWLLKNDYELVASFEELSRGDDEDFGRATWFQRRYENQGRMLIELGPDGSVYLTVESYQDLPESARFRAKMVDQYRRFALWMDGHKSQLVGSDAESINRIIDSRIATLLAKATKAEEAAADDGESTPPPGSNPLLACRSPDVSR